MEYSSREEVLKAVKDRKLKISSATKILKQIKKIEELKLQRYSKAS